MSRHGLNPTELDQFAGDLRARSSAHSAEAARLHTERMALRSRGSEPPKPTIQPVSSDARSNNALRPTSFDGVIGQENAKRMMQRVIAAAKMRGVALDHILLVGAAGTGKTTFSTVIANELGGDCYQIAAPVSLDLLLELRESMSDGDVLFIDEIHMQAIQERRGKESITQPEVFLSLLEDGVISTGQGILDFPRITVIGATTDPGRLPDPFLDRFPLKPVLESYSERELAVMAGNNAMRLGLQITAGAALTFARASRGVPRQINNYVRNAAMLATDALDEDLALEVLEDLNGTTPDGLTRDMAGMLTFLYEKGRTENRDGEVRYQASVNTIATAIGLSRDTKAVALRVEPYLIQRGFVQVGHGGRSLTDKGVQRARQLSTEV